MACEHWVGQADAAGFARAALGGSADFSVLEATDLDHTGPEDPK